VDEKTFERMRVVRLSHPRNCLAYGFQALVQRRGFDNFDIVFQFRIHRLPELCLLIGNVLNRWSLSHARDRWDDQQRDYSEYKAPES
jgi:hypothetical protein